MESLVSGVQDLISYVVPMVVLLGLLIFVHELGHFLVAKYFKVRVETFSLGFGPKIFKIKRGETVYAISAFPLGGYVKMFGDDPTAEVSPELRSVSFSHKPVTQRIGVVLAGPLMNFFFAIVLFACVAAIGEQMLAPKLGDISDKTPAYAAGFRDGDTIVSVDGDKVKSWEDLQHAIEENADHQMKVNVVRDGGANETLQITPKLAQNKNVLSWSRQVGEVDGLSYSVRAPVIGVREVTSAAGAAGLKTGDSIKSVGGVSVTKWREFIAALPKAIAGKSSVDIEVERGLLDDKKADNPEKMKFTVKLDPAAKIATPQQAMAALGVEYPELYLAGLEKGSPAEKAGLKKGDRILSMDGKNVGSFDDVVASVKSFGEQMTKAEKPMELAMVVSRDGHDQSFTLVPNSKERMNGKLQSERRFEIGIHPLIVDAAPPTIENKAADPVAAITRGFSQTIHWTSLTVLSFVRLFQHEVSPKNLGGFLSIGQMAKKTWEIGASPFLNIMAIISINLFILNLFPVPVLDGGHLVFYSIEVIKGAPLSMRKMEIAQQVGMVLLLALMVFAIFNDVSRIFFHAS